MNCSLVELLNKFLHAAGVELATFFTGDVEFRGKPLNPKILEKVI